MDVYFSSKQFLEDQIRIINAPLRLDPEAREAILSAGRENEEAESSSSSAEEGFVSEENKRKRKKNKNKTQLTSQGLDKAISKVNQKKKVYYGKIFTQQAKRHVVMQLQAASADSFLKAHEQVEAMKTRLFVPVDPEISSLTTQESTKLQTRLEGLSSDEIHSLSDSLVNGHNGNSAKLSKALKNYNKAMETRRKYKELKQFLTTTFTNSPQDSIQNNLITTQSPVLDELARLRTLSAKVQAKIAANPEKLEKLLESRNPDISKRAKAYEKTI